MAGVEIYSGPWAMENDERLGVIEHRPDTIQV